MRFIEIAVLGALAALATAPDVSEWLNTALGTALAAAFLKFIREATKKE